MTDSRSEAPPEREDREESLDVLGMIGVVFRRFYFVLPVLVVTAFVVNDMVSSLEREYRARASMLLSNPPVVQPEPEPEDEEGVPPEPIFQNPYDFGTAATALDRIVTSPSMRDQIESQGLTPDYDIDQDGRILSVDATAVGEDVALDTAGYLLEFMSSTLNDLQAETGVPETEWVQTRLLVPPTAEPVPYSGVQAIVMVAFLGVAGSIASAFVGDSLIRTVRRRWRRRAAGRAERARAAAGSKTSSGDADPDVDDVDGGGDTDDAAVAGTPEEVDDDEVPVEPVVSADDSPSDDEVPEEPVVSAADSSPGDDVEEASNEEGKRSGVVSDA